MRYVPNLIPDSSKVLPDYFKGNIYTATKKNSARDFLMWVLGIFFFVGAIVFIKHPILLLLFALTGFILIPPGQKFLEKKLRFRLTPKIKTIAASALFVGSLPLTNHYQEVDRQEAYQQKLLDEKIAKEKAIAEQQEQQRKDSLNFYIEQSNQLGKAHKIDEANKQLQYALSFATSQADKYQIEKEKTGIASIRTSDLIKAGKYKIALTELNNLLLSDPNNSDLLYNRAICYSKTGKIKEAVNDLTPLVEAGNSEAQKMYNKINPIKVQKPVNNYHEYKTASSSKGCLSRQCSAYTKKGSRCRNMTTSCNGYCWRHGG